MNSKLFYPNEKLFKDACINSMDAYNALQKKATDDYEGFWDDYAKEKIDWIKPYTKVLDESDAPHSSWFVNGKLNVSVQCIDRHLKTQKDKTAILFEADDGKTQKITYEELSNSVNQTANLLKNRFNVKKGLDPKTIFHSFWIVAKVAETLSRLILILHED